MSFINITTKELETVIDNALYLAGADSRISTEAKLQAYKILAREMQPKSNYFNTKTITPMAKRKQQNTLEIQKIDYNEYHLIALQSNTDFYIYLEDDPLLDAQGDVVCTFVKMTVADEDGNEMLVEDTQLCKEYFRHLKTHLEENEELQFESEVYTAEYFKDEI